MKRPSLAQTQKLCATRARREPNLSIARDIADLRKTVRAAERRTGSAAGALERSLPAEILKHVWIEGVTPAQITLGVQSAAAAYHVDRALREGGLAAIRHELLSPQLRVRTRVGQQPAV